MRVLISICATIGTILTILTFYKKIVHLVGLFSRKKFQPTNTKHKYAICVAARNEEKVIRNLIESIHNQDYDQNKITLFIIANNCTDKTVDVVKDYINETQCNNVKLYVRDCPEERTKGFALKYLFEQIKKDYGIESFEGYFIFDADNILNPNYITKMNEAFDAGNKIVTSFRNSKNTMQNWISYSYAMHWLRTCLKENRGKSIVNLACRIQGTGFLFANELVKDGWKYTSLTEDRAFCTDAVVQGYRISYCEDAVFYDEQPYKLKIALRQRLRWAKGHLQSTVENEPKLIKNMLKFNKNFAISYDCFWLNFPYSIESFFRKILVYILKICLGIIACTVLGVIWGIVVSYAIGLLKNWGKKMIDVVEVAIWYGKKTNFFKNNNFFKILFYTLMFPFFDIIGKWSMIIAMFVKVEWKPIPHDRVMDVKKLNKN